MIRLSTFTPRMWLILAHDLLATAAAVVASFFIRFEGAGLAERWRSLAILLPVFVVYSGLVYGFAGQVDGIVARIRVELGAEAPVIATSVPSGKVTSTLLRLFSRAPRTVSALPLPAQDRLFHL